MNPKLRNLLDNIIKYNLQNPSWIVDSKVAGFLYKKSLEIKAKNILEIGTSIGYSGLHLALAAKENKGKLYTIESHKKRFEIAKNNFEESGLRNYILQIKGHAPEAIPEISEPWDLIFFDATKCEHVLYFNALKNKIKKGGLLIVDNAISHRDAMADFLEVFENDKSFQIEKYSDFDKGVLIGSKL